MIIFKSLIQTSWILVLFRQCSVIVRIPTTTLILLAYIARVQIAVFMEVIECIQ